MVVSHTKCLSCINIRGTGSTLLLDHARQCIVILTSYSECLRGTISPVSGDDYLAYVFAVRGVYTSAADPGFTEGGSSQRSAQPGPSGTAQWGSSTLGCSIVSRVTTFTRASSLEYVSCRISTCTLCISTVRDTPVEGLGIELGR